MTGRRTICYVTGSRAEFGLMASTLGEIASHPDLRLQIVATGMHLSEAHGRTIGQIRREGWKVDATVPWRGDSLGAALGHATAGLSRVFARLRPDVVLLCGDRVEPFAAASAAHLDGRLVAHVHGGDRALGQSDDTLRHAITKLSHVHFAATPASARRLWRLGEQRSRIRTVGTPGLDGIRAFRRGAGELRPLVVLHPESDDDAAEAAHSRTLVRAIEAVGIRPVTVVYPNNDPGWKGIARVWERLPAPRYQLVRDLPRTQYLQALCDSGILIGNSSSGIIEAASLGVAVINIGTRQQGRERSANVRDVGWSEPDLVHVLRTAWREGHPRPYRGTNVYGRGSAGRRIAAALARIDLHSPSIRRKLIRY